MAAEQKRTAPQRRFALAALACMAALGVQAATNSFAFQERLLALPVSRTGCFIGQSGGRLLIGGGTADYQRSADVFVEQPGAQPWLRFELKTPVCWAGAASGTFVENGERVTKLFVVGGIATNASVTDAVQVLEWKGGTLLQSELPPLPVRVQEPGVGFFEDQPEKQLYVVGGATGDDRLSRRVFRYAFGSAASAWEELPPLPGEGRASPGVLCFYNDVHVFGGDAAGGRPTATALAYRWKVIDGTTFTGWRELAPLPEPLSGPLVFQTGQVHAGVTGGRGADGFSDAIHLYHNVTDTWTVGGRLPQPLGHGAAPKLAGKQLLVGAGGDKKGVTAAYELTLRRLVKRLSAWDYALLFGYFIGVGFMGLYVTRKQRGTAAFALADRQVAWWMAGISMFATGASSISLIAIPAQAFRTSLLWAVPFLMLIPLYYLEAYVIYPLMRKLSLTSTYEYLERRFHPSLRYIASAQCICLQILGRMNMVLLLPALAIAAVTGLSVTTSVLLMGVVTTLYTTQGGLKAVILVEFVQGITMLVGISAMILLAITGLEGGFGDFVAINRQFGRFDLAIWSLDFTLPVFWLIALTPTLNKLAFASDQPVIQRVFATPLKDVRKLAAMFLFCSVFIAFAVNIAGISIFAFFRQHPALLDPAMTNDQVVPLYIVQHIPKGLAGLIIAAVFAAAASTLSGSMNSVATIFTEDFYRLARPAAADRERLTVMRVVTVVAGALATGCALYMAQKNLRSLFQTWNELFALLGGGFLGIYILGIFTHRTHAAGAATGALASIAVTLLVKKFTALHWYGYMPAAVFSCMLIGYGVSLLWPSKSKDLSGLTVFDLKRDLDEVTK